MTRSIFSSSAGKKYGRVIYLSHVMILSHTLFQYGDVFTFTLLGRKVTVALGAKGNNFVLGGKSTAFSAEDAYTVRAIVLVLRMSFSTTNSTSRPPFSVKTSYTMSPTKYSWSKRSSLKSASQLRTSGRT
jgi:hypothetical protein